MRCGKCGHTGHRRNSRICPKFNVPDLEAAFDKSVKVNSQTTTDSQASQDTLPPSLLRAGFLEKRD